MVDAEEAKSIARRALDAMSDQTGIPVAILYEHTEERPYGWVFFYQSVGYLETRNFSSILAGNAPLLVLKETGELKVLGTAYPLEHYLEAYEKAERDEIRES